MICIKKKYWYKTYNKKSKRFSHITTTFKVSAAVKLEEETGADIKFINLSGGVGIPYTPDQTPNDIMAIGEGVRKAFEEMKEKYDIMYL